MSEEEVNLVPLTLDADGKPLPEPLPIPEEPLEEPKLIETEEDTDQHNAVPKPLFPVPMMSVDKGQQMYATKAKAILIAKQNLDHYANQMHKDPCLTNARLAKFCKYVYRYMLITNMNKIKPWMAHPWTPFIKDGVIYFRHHGGECGRAFYQAQWDEKKHGKLPEELKR